MAPAPAIARCSLSRPSRPRSSGESAGSVDGMASAGSTIATKSGSGSGAVLGGRRGGRVNMPRPGRPPPLRKLAVLRSFGLKSPQMSADRTHI